jgi:riboflavin transporter FmnP
MKRQDYRKLTTIAILSALSTVLMMLQFGLPILPVHLQFDFSDLPAVIAAFAYGPVAGAVVEFLKNLLHLPVTTTMGIGELSNFLHGLCFVLPAGLIYQYRRTKNGAIWGAVSGMSAMTLCSFPINYFLTVPLFIRVLHTPEHVILGMYQAVLPAVSGFGEAILIFHMPLTFVKGLLCAVITFLVYKRMSPLLHGRDRDGTDL